MKKIIVILIILNASISYSQIIGIEFYDSLTYYTNGFYIYPSLDLKRSNNNLYFHEKIIFSDSLMPKNYFSYYLEIYKSDFIFLTLIDSSNMGANFYHLIKRKIVYVTSLDSISFKIFNFENTNIVDDINTKLENFNDFNFYRIKSVDKDSIILNNFFDESKILRTE